MINHERNAKWILIISIFELFPMHSMGRPFFVKLIGEIPYENAEFDEIGSLFENLVLHIIPVLQKAKSIFDIT